jgi:hypothetical protein
MSHLKNVKGAVWIVKGNGRYYYIVQLFGQNERAPNTFTVIISRNGKIELLKTDAVAED